MMRLSEFDYYLPKDLIAQYPLPKRDEAKLFVLDRKKKAVHHRLFKDITDYIGKEELVVLNNTKVLPSRIFGKRSTGGKVEVLLVGRKEGSVFKALMKPARLKVGEKIIFNSDSVSGTISAKNEITFSREDAKKIYQYGQMPLPPYIKRPPEDQDNIYYQTVYAKEPGSIASPTAGLHFTEELLEKINKTGIDTAYVTLHVGIGTFKPVRDEDITRHKMEKEALMVSGEAIQKIRLAKEKGKRIFCVGTTSLRAIESTISPITNYQLPITDYQSATDLFIYPGYEFKLASCLLTNFHLPRTTLFMLVCAFAGTELIKKAYQEAVDKKYRFYSYGDAMLII